jgi:nicotinamidase-related amidase
MKIAFDPPHTALLAMDCQTGIVSVYATSKDDFIMRASGALTAARTAGMLIVQVQVGFRPGLPEVNSHNSYSLQSSLPSHTRSSFRAPPARFTRHLGRSLRTLS